MLRKFFIDMIGTEWVQKVAIIVEISKTAMDLFSQRRIDGHLDNRCQCNIILLIG
jgi:hypothetical protein